MMKDPDEPIDDLDQTSLNMNQGSQNKLFATKVSPTKKTPEQFLQQDYYGNIGLSIYDSIRPQEQDEAGYCCSSAILLIECVHSYLQLMKYMIPIGYEILLEVQKIIEFYFYQTFILFTEKQSINELINSNVDTQSLSKNIYNVDSQVYELSQKHDNLIQQLPYKDLKKLIVRCLDYFEQDNAMNQFSVPNQLISSQYCTQSQAYNKNYHNINQPYTGRDVGCNKDMNIFTLSCANNKMNSSVHSQYSINTETNSIKKQKMIQYDLQQRLSSVQSIFTLNKYMHLVQGQIIQQLSLIDTSISVQQFVIRINEDIQKYLKQMKYFIMRDFCLQQLEKENIFQDFSLINWKPGDYTIETQKPMYIENSLYFLKEFKQKVENEQNLQSKNVNNTTFGLTPSVRLDIYRIMIEVWIQNFLKNIQQVKKFSDKGRSNLLNHYLVFIRDVDQIFSISQLKTQNDSVEKYIKMWNTQSTQELLQYILSMKNQLPLSYLIQLIQSNDKLTLLICSQRQYDTFYANIYKEFLQFTIENS